MSIDFDQPPLTIPLKYQRHTNFTIVDENGIPYKNPPMNITTKCMICNGFCNEGVLCCGACAHEKCLRYYVKYPNCPNCKKNIHNSIMDQVSNLIFPH